MSKDPCLIPQNIAPIRSAAEAVAAVAPDYDLLRGGGWAEAGEDEEEDFGGKGEENWWLSGLVGVWRIVWIAWMVFRIQ